IHSIFSMLQLSRVYVTEGGRLIGVVALSDPVDGSILALDTVGVKKEIPRRLTAAAPQMCCHDFGEALTTLIDY
ncbi:hypothetical protein ANCCEY_15891, partial [Ancylostoma ceylanicum]